MFFLLKSRKDYLFRKSFEIKLNTAIYAMNRKKKINKFVNSQ